MIRSARTTLAEVPLADLSVLAQFQAFFDALDRGEAMPLTSLREAARTFHVIFAPDKSAAQAGAPIAVS